MRAFIFYFGTCFFYWCSAERYLMQKAWHILRHISCSVLFIVHFLASLPSVPLPLASVQMAGRLHGTAFWWSNWVVVVHPAGSWCPLFTVEPLVPSFFSWHQDQCCPTEGAKMGEGLQLQLPKSTQVPGHDHRKKILTNLPPPWNVYFPVKWSSRLSSYPLVSPTPPTPPPLGLPFISKESNSNETWSARSI